MEWDRGQGVSMRIGVAAFHHLLELIAIVLLSLLGPIEARAQSPEIGFDAGGISARCQAPQLRTDADKSYNMEVGAWYYLPYALASMNAYEETTTLPLSLYDSGWKFQKTLSYDSGLSADYYFKEGAELEVLLAFRGTRGPNLRDWNANFSWMTNILPLRNHYHDARPAFEIVREDAARHARGRVVRFLATGHSLGGGLAQYIAFSYPCVSAAVFNSSCVTHQTQIAAPASPLIVQIHERGDKLTSLCWFMFSDRETENFRHYPIEATNWSPLQHATLPLAIGMARFVVHCQYEQRIGKRNCHVPMRDARARRAYCSTWGRIGPDDICRGWDDVRLPSPVKRQTDLAMMAK